MEKYSLETGITKRKTKGRILTGEKGRRGDLPPAGLPREAWREKKKGGGGGGKGGNPFR